MGPGNASVIICLLKQVLQGMLAEVMGLGNVPVVICLLKQVLQGMLAVFAKSRSKVLVFSYSTRVSACLLLLSEGECLFSLTQHG